MDYSISIGELDFVWDENKNQINIVKHKVSFQEAATVFEDEFAKITYDKKNSLDEDRFRIVGASDKGNLLMVCHCERAGNVIRIISARGATKSEKQDYYDQMQGGNYGK